MNYCRQFKKVCRHLGIKGKTLHSLRHTYAVRRWAITGDIKMVSQEISHSSVMMTEKYTRFNLRKLKLLQVLKSFDNNQACGVLD